MSAPRLAEARPLAEAELAVEMRQTASRIANDLIRAVDDPAVGFDLASAGAGVTLALASLGTSLEQPECTEAARRAWERTLAALAEAVSTPGLYDGFCGPAWVAAHLGERLDPDLADDSQHDEIETTLVRHFEAAPRHAGYDLISGFVGSGVYALERWPRGASPRILELLVARIVDLAEDVETGVTWTTPPELLPALHRREAPRGYRNLGLAHGVPGVVAFLARVSRLRGLDAHGARTLEGGVEWLRSAARPLANGLQYTHWLAIEPPAEERERPRRSRLAWCYGDLGVAAALCVAGHAERRPDWIDAAVSIARNCAAVPVADAGVQDTGLCHGAAGVALLFTRLARTTGDDVLAAAARRWFRQTLAMLDPGLPFGGCFALQERSLAVERFADLEYDRVAAPSFLVGAGGVAMALASGVAGIGSDWDRVLLVSG